MNKFNTLFNKIKTEYLFFEDYSNKICKVPDGYRYSDDCANTCLISEDSLYRTINIMKNDEFAILTAYRSNHSKEENIKRNRILRSKLNERKMGVHQLIGHWQEAPDGYDYMDCPDNLKTDTIERSYLVKKPADMSSEEFKEFILSLLTIDGETQDGAILKTNDGIYFIDNHGSMFKISDTFELGKVAQAYSQHIKNQNIPFVFEGIEVPQTNLGKQIFTMNNIKY